MGAGKKKGKWEPPMRILAEIKRLWTLPFGALKIHSTTTAAKSIPLGNIL